MLEKTDQEKTSLASKVDNLDSGNRQEANTEVAKIKKLTEELKKSEETSAVLKQILAEIGRLKMSPLRNLTGDSIDDLREERDRLIEENTKLKTGDAIDDGKLNEGGSPSLVKYLRSKVRDFNLFDHERSSISNGLWRSWRRRGLRSL